MPGMISKQPNGLYCRISTIVEAPTRWDMTKEGLRELLVLHGSLDSPDQTIEDWLSKWEVTFEEAIKQIGDLNLTREEIRKWLVSVGYSKVNEFMKNNARIVEEESYE